MGVSRAIPSGGGGGSNELLIIIRAIDRATNVLKTVGKGTKILGTDVKDLAATWYLASQAVKTFSSVVKAAYDFGKEGAQIERLRETGTKLAQGFGVDMAEAVRKIKAASLDTISANQAIAATNRLILLGISTDTTQMAKLMEIAALRGRAFGIDTEAAFDRITLGIGRLSTRILDDIGIVIDGETAYANFGKAIGKTADQLTEQEKRLALTNAIIDEGNTLLAISGGLVDDNASKIARLETHWTDFTNRLKEAVSGPLADVVTSLDLIAFGAGQVDAALINHQDEILKTAKTYAEFRDEMLRAQAVAKEWKIMGRDLRMLPPEVLSDMDRQLLGAWLGAQQKKKPRPAAGTDQADELARMRNWQTRAPFGPSALPLMKAMDEKLKELEAEAFDASKEAAARRLDLDIDYGRKKEDIAIDLARDLEDINIKLQDDVEDITRKHKEKLIDVEKKYYRDIDRIMRRFEMAKLRALIDLDGRALFEAEAARDADLADAQATRKEHREEESDSFAQKLRDQEDQAERERRQAMLDNERKRADAARDYQRQLDDQRRAWGQRLYELYALGAQEFQIVRSQQMAITAIMQEQWQIRADAYAAYLRTISPTGTSAIPGTVTPTATGGTATAQNVTVTLNVTGDGVLAQAMRQSTINTVYDMIYYTQHSNAQ